MLEKGSDEAIIESHKMVKDRVEMVKTKSNGVKNLRKVVNFDSDWFVAKQLKVEMVSKLLATGIVL